MALAASRTADENRSMQDEVALDNSDCAVVDRAYHWLPIDEFTPRSTKLQLINRQFGVANYGVLTPQTERFYTHWAPLPTFDKRMKAH